jgi:hypothetical protein
LRNGPRVMFGFLVKPTFRTSGSSAIHVELTKWQGRRL